MIGHQHITFSLFKPLFPFNYGKTPHSIKNNVGPNITGHPKELWIGPLGNGKKNQERKHYQNGQNH
jgi:hypothetical protein